MSFRERASQQSEWDVDEDSVPPMWQDRPSSPRADSPQDVPAAELPAWSHGVTGDEVAEESYLPPPRSRRTAPVPSDRPGAAWPNLRDSLRGSAAAASSGSRAGRRSSASALPPPRRSESVAAPSPDRLDDDLAWAPLDGDAPLAAEEIAYDSTRYPARRGPATRTRQRSRRATPPSNRPTMQIPPALAALAAAQDRLVVGAVGLSAFSLLLMAATISSRSNALPPWIVLHLDAAGNPDHWGTTSTVWRLPLMTAMLTLASFAGALFVGRRDPFAARFLLGAALFIHVLAWVGLVRVIW
ncbi:MAG: hypothetical protein QOF73_226 [Thermomicrobiales bacterium]|nr:hypothetical protein [Thermomicrobiales bacterium]